MGLLRSLPYPETSYACKEAARHYARLGASTLILAVRNFEKGNAAKKDIETTAAKGTEIQVWQIDMARYDSVKAFAARVEAELNRLDIFHANAGLACAKFTTTEGNETSITINVISTPSFLCPQFNTRPTVVITTSGANRNAKFPQKSEPEIFAALNTRTTQGAPTSRGSKGCVHGNESSSGEDDRKGSSTLIHAVTQGAKSHGQYLADCKIDAPAPVRDGNKDVQDRIWRELKEKLEAIQPGVTGNF
ncbi:hypothetical protein V1515DRAFT_647121 [Lipomyces mesembrius]